jgi:ABC-type sugar transport system ATPase subunit
MGVKCDSPNAGIMTLSGGNQQKAVLARTLCADARVLLCDEPTAGVDVGARGEIYAKLARLAEDGMGIVMSSSDMLELLGACHRIVVVREGRIAADLSHDEATEERIMQAQLPLGARLSVEAAPA